MKIASLPTAMTAVNPPAKAHGSRAPTAESVAAANEAPPAAPPANPAAQPRRPDSPPGLEKVLQRLQGMADLNKGQTNAMQRIERNLSRYTEMQALADPPPPAPITEPEATPTPTPDAPPAEGPIVTGPVDTTPPSIEPPPLDASAGTDTPPAAA
jgi:hypothetical protein